MNDLERCIAAAKEGSAHIRREDHFILPFLDLARLAPDADAPHLARVTELAEKRERWADAIDALIRLIEGT
jgi:hypothetical protein